MNITVKDHSIYIDENRVSNFAMRRLSETEFEVNNGKQVARFHIENINLNNFRIAAETQGNFIFKGTPNELRAIIEFLSLTCNDCKYYGLKPEDWNPTNLLPWKVAAKTSSGKILKSCRFAYHKRIVPACPANYLCKDKFELKTA